MTFYDVWELLNFAIGLLAAEFLICTRFQKRKHFWLLLIAGILPSLIVSFVWQYIPIHNSWFTSFKFMFVFALTMVMPVAAFKTDKWSYLFAGIMAYCVQHIAYQTYSIIDTLSNFAMPQWAKIIVLIAVSATAYAGLHFFFVRKRAKAEPLEVDNHILLILSGIVLAVTVVISFFGAIYSFKLDKVMLIIVCLFSIISCSLSMFMEVSLLKLKKDEIELSIFKHMLYESQHQYADSKESIDIINVKCHDLRHQLSALKGKVDKEELSRISAAIDIYDGSFKTGNDALDVVLTEKNLLCRNKGIRLTCMLDGTLLSRMKESDIYSLFGNAIENAVNGVSGLKEEKRVISLRSVKREGFGIIFVENYYEGEIALKDGMPVTEKDSNYHGFGMKSMKLIVDEYGGELEVSVSGDIFRLEFILPI